MLGRPPHGGWAERVAVPAASLAVVPAAIRAETAATLPLAGLTALRLMPEAGPATRRRRRPGRMSHWVGPAERLSATVLAAPPRPPSATRRRRRRRTAGPRPRAPRPGSATASSP